MSRLRSVPVAIVAGLLVAACVGAATSPGPSSTPTPPASPAIEHPTGPSTVILRMSTGGGFVAPGVLLSEIPEFSLYGDGTVVFRDPAKAYVEPSPSDGPARLGPFATARLSEAAIQAVLADAIGPGGLGSARDEYAPGGIADAPSTTFTLHAGGLDKTVTVGALGFDQPVAGPDAAAREAFRALAERLHRPDVGGAVTSDYAPVAYRGILSEGVDGNPAVRPLAWPWKDFGPGDFKPSPDPSSMQIPTRTLAAADVARLGIGDLSGGASQIVLKAPDGKVYALTLRPLLPDEKG